jgi:hypothetical protein
MLYRAIPVTHTEGLSGIKLSCGFSEAKHMDLYQLSSKHIPTKGDNNLLNDISI